MRRSVFSNENNPTTVEPVAFNSNAPFGNPLSPAVSPVRAPAPMSPATSPMWTPPGGGVSSPNRSPPWASGAGAGAGSSNNNLKTFSFEDQRRQQQQQQHVSSPGGGGGGGTMSPASPHRLAGRQVTYIEPSCIVAFYSLLLCRLKYVVNCCAGLIAGVVKVKARAVVGDAVGSAGQARLRGTVWGGQAARLHRGREGVEAYASSLIDLWWQLNILCVG